MVCCAVNLPAKKSVQFSKSSHGDRPEPAYIVPVRMDLEQRACLSASELTEVFLRYDVRADSSRARKPTITIAASDRSVNGEVRRRVATMALRHERSRPENRWESIPQYERELVVAFDRAAEMLGQAAALLEDSK